MNDPIFQLGEIIATLCDLPSYIDNHTNAAFTLGCVVTELEHLKNQLKSMNNGDL